jgi:hypothetical protein
LNGCGIMINTENLAMTMAHCIAACQECHATALQTIAWSLRKGGEAASADQMQILFDCASICDTCIDFMARGSEAHRLIGRACAEICTRCADACEALQLPELHAQIDACRICAESCWEMAG